MTDRNNETVQETPTSFDDAFDAAFEEAGGSVDGNPFDDAPESNEDKGSEAPESPESASETPEAPEDENAPESPQKASGEGPEKASEGEGEEEESLSLSKEELDAIKANPATFKLYKSLMKGATQKYQEISGHKKLLDAFEKNPRAVVEQAAEQLGLQLVDPNSQSAAREQSSQEAASEAVDDVMEDLTRLFGEEGAAAFRPVAEKMMRNMLERELQPIRATNQEVLQRQAVERAQQTADTFRATHPDITPEVELKMMEVAPHVQPAPGATPDQYLEFLYKVATAGQAPKAAAKEVVKRVKAAQSGREPSRSTAPAPAKKSAVAGGMSLDDAFDAAFAEAKEELGSGKLFGD